MNEEVSITYTIQNEEVDVDTLVTLGTLDGEGEFKYDNTYFAIDYVKSNGFQYVDTNVSPNISTSVEFVMALDEISDTVQPIFGVRNGQVLGSYNMFLCQKKLRWDYTYTINNLMYDEILTYPTYVNANAESVIVGDSINEYGFTDTSISENSIYLFSVNELNSPAYFSSGLSLYYFSITQDGVLVRDFIPVIDRNSVPCLYDLVTEALYYNEEIGNFVVGN